MINKELSFDLPPPWMQKKFETSQIGTINFLVGPNGSGKSKFAAALHSQLPNARMLGTDRLSGMEQTNALRSITGDHFPSGFPKNQFGQYKNAGLQGSGIDTLVLLEERMDLRIQVEATLSHLFGRQVKLEWDSGSLAARAILRSTGASYRFDRDECHGIKELLVMLTHLYNDEHAYLIIDEPELNLHPQYQSFFLQEVRRIAGNPDVEPKRKVVFLVTHSPFILDFRTVEDVKSVISFNLTHSVPRHIFGLGQSATAKLATLVPRLNVHHKQLFFSDHPIFVEGILDAQFVGTLQESRGVSVAGAGSCIIDAGGCEEVNRYLELCTAFGKGAWFLYDLDSLFGGNLRGCVGDDSSVRSFLLGAGVGGDFAKYCGELERSLTAGLDRLLSGDAVPALLTKLVEFLGQLGPRSSWTKKKWSKARVALVTGISRYRLAMVGALAGGLVEEIEGRLAKIASALRQKNVILLKGGTLERYLPSYAGDDYNLADETKKAAVEREMVELAIPRSEAELAARYGDLYEAVCSLPAKVSVDVDRVLRDYLGDYIHHLQASIASNPTWQLAEVQSHLNAVQRTAAKVFSVITLMRYAGNEFGAVIGIVPMLGHGQRRVQVNHQTVAGMGGFEIVG